jgi:hypothetical protein
MMKCMNSFRAQRVWGLRPHRGVKPRKRGSFTPLAGALRFGPAGERLAPAPETADGLASKPSFFNWGANA